MEKKEGFGFITLAKKTLAVIATSLSTLLIDQPDALPATATIEEVSKNIDYEHFRDFTLKPQLVLKLNQSNPNNLAMNPLHGSHRSHSSHSSHSSHASHYSSSPSSSYTPNTSSTTDTAAQSTYIPSATPKTNSTRIDTAATGNKVTFHLLGSRDLKQGCEGTDVQQLQRGLITLGYKMDTDGIYATTTELAVMKFQVANNLTPNGIVDALTLKKLQSLLK